MELELFSRAFLLLPAAAVEVPGSALLGRIIAKSQPAFLVALEAAYRAWELEEQSLIA